MKIRKKCVLTVGILMLVIGTTIPLSGADGCHFSTEYLHLYEPYQKAVIYWDGVSETLILASAARADNLTDIAWIVPILSTTSPNVTAGNISVFRDVVDYFKDTDQLHSFDDSFVMQGGGKGNVTVVEIKEIDIYDIIILQATNTSDLISWLNDHHFQVPEEAYSVFDSYVQTGQCYFVINKIDLKNRFQPVLDDIKNGTIPYDSPLYVEYETVLFDLRAGMATPLKFEFTPPEPYYPLTISSLNAGYGRIEVYVVADHPVTDINNVLRLSACKSVSDDLRQTLQSYFSADHAEFVTRLTYYGMLDELSDDAVFTYFPLSSPETPVFVHSTADVEVIVSQHYLWGVAWSQTGEVFEVQYRFDGEQAWKLANGTKLWVVSLDTTSFSNGEHTVYVRVVSSDFGSPAYSEVTSLGFTTLNDVAVTPMELQNYNQTLGAILLSGFVVLSLVAVAVISWKITS